MIDENFGAKKMLAKTSNFKPFKLGLQFLSVKKKFTQCNIYYNSVTRVSVKKRNCFNIKWIHFLTMF